MKIEATKTTWYIINGDNNKYCGKLEAGHVLESTSNITTFESYDLWKESAKSLGLLENDKMPAFKAPRPKRG